MQITCFYGNIIMDSQLKCFRGWRTQKRVIKKDTNSLYRCFVKAAFIRINLCIKLIARDQSRFQGRKLSMRNRISDTESKNFEYTTKRYFEWRNIKESWKAHRTTWLISNQNRKCYSSFARWQNVNKCRQCRENEANDEI